MADLEAFKYYFASHRRVDKTSMHMMNKYGGGEHPCHSPLSGRKNSSTSPLMLTLWSSAYTCFNKLDEQVGES